MSEKNKPQIKASDVRGLKFLKVLKPLLKHLHSIGTQRDRAGNRQLHMDQYCTMVLLWLYSPCLTSLRSIQQAAELQKIQKRFGLPRAALGSLSESVRIFDPEPLKRVATELGTRLPKSTPKNYDQRLNAIGKALTAVDGSVIKILKRVAQLAWIRMPNGHRTCGYRLHTQFEILRGLPHRIDTTSANPAGENDERVVLERTLQEDRLYVMDRGYSKYSLFNAIHSKKSSYLCRVRDGLGYTVLQTKELTQADQAVGVLNDQLIELKSHPRQVDHPLRLICIRCTPHTSRGVYRKGRPHSSAPSSDGVLRVVTDMLDVPAELIAEIYRLRWTIENYQARYTGRHPLYLLAA
jgi:hypothetical protein